MTRAQSDRTAVLNAWMSTLDLRKTANATGYTKGSVKTILSALRKEGVRVPYQKDIVGLLKDMISVVTEDCIEWPFARNVHGYGIVNIKGIGKKIASRAAWEIVNNKTAPRGMCVCHKCDNPPCVNPRHLFLGTHLDNIKDKIAKGRNPKGSDIASAKLREADVMAIRDTVRSGEKVAAIAERYGVLKKAIYDILNGVTWKHI